MMRAWFRFVKMWLERAFRIAELPTTFRAPMQRPADAAAPTRPAEPPSGSSSPALPSSPGISGLVAVRRHPGARMARPMISPLVHRPGRTRPPGTSRPGNRRPR
jgi:hypothetical protein